MATATEAVASPAAEQRDQPWRPSSAGWVARLSVLAGLLLLLIWAVQTVSNTWAKLICLAVIYAIIGLSLNIVMGYVGQVSLGHHAFVGLAAYASAFMVTEKKASFGLGVLVACTICGLSAGLLGLVAMRVKGLYLALITLTFGFVAVNSLFEIPAITGGGQGLEAPRPEQFTSNAAYAYLCLAFLGLVMFVDWRLLSSKVGRGILAVKESEAVAASYAVNVTLYKVFAFVVSGVFAGLAGSLFAHLNTVVVATDFQFGIALLWVLMVVVGGLGNRIGVVLASAFFALFSELISLIGPLEHFLAGTFKREAAEFEGVIGALLALLTIILHPGGVGDQVAPFVRWFSGKKFTMHAEDHHGGGAEKGPGRLAKLTGRAKGVVPDSTAAGASPSAGSADASTSATDLKTALSHASGAAEGDGHSDASDSEDEATVQLPASSSENTAQIPATKTAPKSKTLRGKRKSATEDGSSD